MTTSSTDRSPIAGILVLAPLMAAVFVVFLVTGMALPVLPLHVRDGLGLGTFVVGIVAGAQFAASLVSRVSAGVYSDRRGAKRAVIVGLAVAAASGLVYLASLLFAATPLLSVIVLIAGRALLGGAESFIITGAQSWALGLAGSRGAGQAIAWIGTALYAALAVGAPAGSLLYQGYGFGSIGLATTLIPLATLALVLPLRPVTTNPPAKRALPSVARAVWLPGLGLAFGSLGLGAMTTFSVLLFIERGWNPGWLAFTVFSIAFIAARMTLSHLGDRIGGAKVALIFSLVEAAGLALIAFSPFAWAGFLGAALTGFGYSLVYPGLGAEAVLRAPVESRGLAMGIYTAFLDIALGLLSPILGLVAASAGLGAVFLVSALLVAAAAPIAAWLLAHPLPRRLRDSA